MRAVLMCESLCHDFFFKLFSANVRGVGPSSSYIVAGVKWIMSII